jgi:thiol-disulfide isomerase/thioredoxin
MKKVSILKTYLFFILFSAAGAAVAENTGEQFDFYENSMKYDFFFKKSDSERVEVIYFFSFSCPACQAYQPTSNLIENSVFKNSKVNFNKIPVEFRDGWEYSAKMYFVLKNIGRMDLYEVIFDKLSKKEISTPQNDYQIVSILKIVGDIEENVTKEALNEYRLNYQLDVARKITEELKVVSTPSYAIITEDGTMYYIPANAKPDVLAYGINELIKMSISDDK